ncbi:hypothetical protein E4T56_gene12113 [Termitomyces sp. T112]|nr:hypothetical protein E4T56_gene12113 [Termitomyces sp. T112]
MLSLKDIPSHVAHKVAEDFQSLHQSLRDEIHTTNQAYSKHANAQCNPTPNWLSGSADLGGSAALGESLLGGRDPLALLGGCDPDRSREVRRSRIVRKRDGLGGVQAEDRMGDLRKQRSRRLCDQWERSRGLMGDHLELMESGTERRAGFGPGEGVSGTSKKKDLALITRWDSWQ